MLKWQIWSEARVAREVLSYEQEAPQARSGFARQVRLETKKVLL